MNHIDLFRLLEAMNPTVEQLETYIGLRKHVFPTPLYIKTHINGYQITLDPDEYEIKGIIIKTGIVLIEPLILKKRKKIHLRRCSRTRSQSAPECPPDYRKRCHKREHSGLFVPRTQSSVTNLQNSSNDENFYL